MERIALYLSEGALGHLGEIMRRETDGVDPRGGCIHCVEIVRALEEIDPEFGLAPPEAGGMGLGDGLGG